MHPKVKRPSSMVLSNFENSGNKYKEVISPMSGYQDHLSGVRFAKKCDSLGNTS